MTTAAGKQSHTSPFHVGEQAIQARLGVRETMEHWGGQVIRPWLPEQHRDFYTQLPFVVAAAEDANGSVWATMLTGKPGFIQSPDPMGLLFQTELLPGDALEDALVAGADLGLLGIELGTRRRNRVNGTITEIGRNGIRFEVGQAFGNCPQYITERDLHPVEIDHNDAVAETTTRLDQAAQAWIATADTLFIASGYRQESSDDTGSGNPDAARAANGMDASHRGGTPGFVKVLSDTRIVFPDYAGNNHFNTIGNLMLDPRVGLLFVDFKNGGLLQITGRATIDWDSPDVATHPGAQRLVTIDIERIVRLQSVLPLRWSEPQGAIRSLRLVDRIRESDDVVSFEFIARDAGRLPPFKAGQHLPVELTIDGQTETVGRTYSLSNAPRGTHYRISVKREPQGLVSNYLHDQLDVGDVISARNPAGEFVLRDSSRPVVLVSAGIGVTPMVSMLHELSDQADERPLIFVHGARSGRQHALADEVHDVVRRNPYARSMTLYSQPNPEDREGRDFDRTGRVDGELLAELNPALDADFYLCGPVAFLADLQAELEALGVPGDRIIIETF